MSFPERSETDGGKLVPLTRLFLRDFAHYAGRRGIAAAALVTLGALLEGLSLALIVPLLGIVTASGTPFGRLEGAAAAVFDLFRVETPFAKLALLLALFGLLMIVRALVIATRDVTVAELTTGFVETQRLRIAEQLAAAPWDQVVRLRHARITHLMSGDIQRIGAAANFLLRTLVAVAMLAAQCILVFLLAPVLAAIALAMLALSAIVFVPGIRRAHVLGGVVTHSNLSLLNATAQFLGGLKLAMSQNLQSSFLAEFRQTLHDLSRRQVDFLRQQTNSRLALTTLSALAGGLLVLIGFGAFEVAPATLITLLLVIARMSGPATAIQQGTQQLANALPAYRAVKDLEQELASIAPAATGPAGSVVIAEEPIVFEHVSFQHAPDEAEAGARGIRDVSLVIAPGDFVGVSDPSGAGKTTFADLLVGLYPPQQGRIVIAGTALEGAALAAWRDCIAYVAQDAFLFHDSVRRNLA